MHYQKSLSAVLVLILTIGHGRTANAHDQDKDALHASNVFQLSSNYVTDEFCVPGVGMHYLDLTKPVYGNPQAGFDKNGELLFFQYLFNTTDFDAQLMAGVFADLKTHKHAKAERIKMSFGQARPEYIPQQYRDIVCNPQKPDSNLCAPHYDVTFFVVKDKRLQKACDGVDVPTRFPDPRNRYNQDDAKKPQ